MQPIANWPREIPDLIEIVSCKKGCELNELVGSLTQILLSIYMDFKTKPKIGICPAVPPRKSSQLSNSNLHQMNSPILCRSSSEANTNLHTNPLGERSLSKNQEDMFNCLGKSSQLCDGRSSLRGSNPTPSSCPPISPIRAPQQFPWISNGHLLVLYSIGLTIAPGYISQSYCKLVNTSTAHWFTFGYGMVIRAKKLLDSYGFISQGN
ncbi:hypothetical protein ACTXT7_000817 [Hymenolepis weldensis]